MNDVITSTATDTCRNHHHTTPYDILKAMSEDNMTIRHIPNATKIKPNP